MKNGELLKEKRKETGLSQKDFAFIYGIPFRTIQNWESGKSNMKDYEWDLLKRAIDCDEEYICNNLDPENTLKEGWKEFLLLKNLHQ